MRSPTSERILYSITLSSLTITHSHCWLGMPREERVGHRRDRSARRTDWCGHREPPLCRDWKCSPLVHRARRFRRACEERRMSEQRIDPAPSDPRCLREFSWAARPVARSRRRAIASLQVLRQAYERSAFPPARRAARSSRSCPSHRKAIRSLALMVRLAPG